MPSLALIDFRLDSLYGTQNNVALPAFVVRIYLVDERYRVGGNFVIAEGFDKFLFEHIFFKHVFAVSKDKKRWTARMLANGALCIALATVLSFVTLYKMPQGGTITLASMLPIFLFSYAYGVGPGMLVGAAYGFVQFLQGGLYFVHPIELLLDYPLAFAMLGLAGLANKFSDKWGMIPGIILGTFGRFVCAFLSGMIFFGMYAPEGQNLVVYSIVYNGLYLVPEAIICIVLALIPQIRQLAKRLALQD